MLSNRLFFDLSSLWIGRLDTVAFGFARGGDAGAGNVVTRAQRSLADASRYVSMSPCVTRVPVLPGLTTSQCGCECRRIKWADKLGLQERGTMTTSVNRVCTEACIFLLSVSSAAVR